MPLPTGCFPLRDFADNMKDPHWDDVRYVYSYSSIGDPVLANCKLEETSHLCIRPTRIALSCEDHDYQIGVWIHVIEVRTLIESVQVDIERFSKAPDRDFEPHVCDEAFLWSIADNNKMPVEARIRVVSLVFEWTIESVRLLNFTSSGYVFRKERKSCILASIMCPIKSSTMLFKGTLTHLRPTRNPPQMLIWLKTILIIYIISVLPAHWKHEMYSSKLPALENAPPVSIIRVRWKLLFSCQILSFQRPGCVWWFPYEV